VVSRVIQRATLVGLVTATVMGVLQLAAAVAAAPDSKILFEDDAGISVTEAEVRHYFAPYGAAGEFADMAKVPNIELAVENIYISKILSQREVKETSLNEEAQAWIAADAVRRQLMREWVDAEQAAQLAEVDWDGLAKEQYLARPENFKSSDKIRARHILLPTEGRRLVDVMIEADSVRSRALSGEDFAVLADSYTEPDSPKVGGDLGYFTRGQMVRPFEEAAFELEVGDISDLVITQFGVHLIKVTDKAPGQLLSFEEVRDRMIKQLKVTVANEAREGILREVRSRVFELQENVDMAAIEQMRADAAAVR
jgi:peptidyl-prolyl cis-trans isomerase C